MKYQLVLQWSTADMDFDRLIQVEDELIAGLSELHEVDGHDFGSQQCNIFVITEKWRDALNLASSILKEYGAWSSVSIGYRAVNQDEYVTLWPEQKVSFSVL